MYLPLTERRTESPMVFSAFSIVKRKTGIAPENIVITPLKESEDAEDTTQTDETSADTSYEEDSETSAQPYEDTAIDTTDIYD